MTNHDARQARPWGQVYKRNDGAEFTVDFWHDGVRYRRAGGKTWAGADKKRRTTRTLLEAGTPIEDVLASVFGDVHGSTLTFRDAAALYLAAGVTRKGKAKRESSRADDATRLALACRASWTAKVLARVTRGDIEAWIEERAKSREVRRKRARRPGESVRALRRAKDRIELVTIAGPSRATLAKDVFLVSALFSWAERAGYVTGNPARGLDILETKGRTRGTYLTAEEARALIDAAPPLVRPLLLAAVHTGMRRGELLGLEWRDVDLARRELVIRPEVEKADRGRTVPMTADLHATLAALSEARQTKALDGSDRVFVLGDGQPMTKGALRVAWDRLLLRCEGVPLAKRNALRFHDLRHTAASLMVGAGVPLFDVAKILGHSTLAVTMRYAHFAPESARAAVDRLGAALGRATSAVPRRRAELGVRRGG